MFQNNSAAILAGSSGKRFNGLINSKTFYNTSGGLISRVVQKHFLLTLYP